MLRQPIQIWRSCKTPFFRIKCCAHIVTNFLFVKIFLSVPCIYYKLMKINFAIYLVLSLSSWWQQPLGKIYGLWYQNEAMVRYSFASRNATSSLRAEVELCDLSAFVNELRGTKSCLIKIIYKRALHETLRQYSLYSTNVPVDNWNSN